MVGQRTVTKPSRSDQVLDADQQLKIASQIRAQFDSIAPKRPPKPSRSEPDSTTTKDNDPSTYENIPELDKLRSLQSQSHVMYPAESADMVQDEFVETHYYKELVSIDKEHHTTGSGFIRVTPEGNGQYIDVGNGHGRGSGDRPVYKSNPATNDWIPSVEYDQAFISSKPNRSEGC